MESDRLPIIDFLLKRANCWRFLEGSTNMFANPKLSWPRSILVTDYVRSDYFQYCPWRIIPGGKWIITLVSKSPKWGCSPSKKAKMVYKWGVTDHLLTAFFNLSPKGFGCLARPQNLSKFHVSHTMVPWSQPIPSPRKLGTCSLRARCRSGRQQFWR